LRRYVQIFLMKNGEAPSPVANRLFTVDNNQTKVDKEKTAQFFDTYVAKTLYLCKWARPNLQMAATFLFTRVQACDKDNYKNLIPMLQFVRATKGNYCIM
jgi:hypothetical protein